jgi:hypothetical protein
MKGIHDSSLAESQILQAAEKLAGKQRLRGEACRLERNPELTLGQDESNHLLAVNLCSAKVDLLQSPSIVAH